MNLIKMYKESKSYFVALNFLGCFIFLINFKIENIVIKIIFYILSFFFFLNIVNFICKILILKKEIKQNITETKIIEVSKINDIVLINGYRRRFEKEYFGITFITKKNKYIFYYKEPLKEDSDFILYNKLLNKDSVKIEFYKKSKVIKKILTKL